MIQKNLDIRQAAKNAGVRLWMVGEQLGGMSDANFSRLLRKELDESTKKRIFSIIETLKAETEMEQAVVPN